MSNKNPLKGIKRGFLNRALATGKVAGSALHLAGRRVLKAAEGEKDGLIGAAIAQELDQMKGVAMKVGQILSYFDGALPEQAHEALQALQKGSRSVEWPVMKKVLEEAFGDKVENLFESFDSNPIASASIGQVYRARHAGQDVAVKIQYPDVKETLKGDFSRLKGFSQITSLATAVDGPALVRELEARVVEECDYLQEAKNQEAFARAFQDDTQVSIPQVFSDRTRMTVFTSRWSEGLDFYEFCKQASSERRNRAALTVVRFAYRSIFQLKRVNADPHPGNYLFPLKEDRVVFLDFGCVRAFDDSFIEKEKELCRTVLRGDRQGFEGALRATGMVKRPEKFDFENHWELLNYQLRPYLSPSFRFTKEYLREGIKFTGPGNPNLRILAIPPQWIWLQRLQWGLHAVLVQMKAEGEFAEVFKRFLG